MPERYEIPTLEGLAKSQPDYVRRLEEGLRQIRSLADKSNERLAKLVDTDQLLSSLRQEGVEAVIESPLREESRRGGKLEGITVRGILRISYPPISEAKVRGGMSLEEYSRIKREKSRKVEDLVEDYFRGKEEDVRNFMSEGRRLQRAYEDFSTALSELTKLTPLTEIDPNNQSLHFYVVRKDGVYEVHIDMVGPKVNGPYKSGSLTPDMFSNKHYLEEFRRISKGIKGNAYMVTNPSDEVPLETMVVRGFGYAALQIIDLKEAQEKKEDKGESPAQQLFNNLRRAIGKLRKKPDS